MGSFRTAVRDALVCSGLYRPGQWSRLTSAAARRRFQFNTDFYHTLLPPNSLVFDVGANIGERSEELLAAGATVVAFEPQPRCAQQLRARCRSRRDRLSTVESALGSAPGSATLYMTSNGAESSLSSNWVSAPKVAATVDVTTLDASIARFGAPYYCKIDVEGWELEVLKGLSQPLPFVSLEFHDRVEDLEKAQRCLDYVSKLAEVEFNLTAAEVPEFQLEKWLPVEEFPRVVEHNIRGNYALRYGDIFVRTPLLVSG
jgi:FkbM family methyltransferase